MKEKMILEEYQNPETFKTEIDESTNAVGIKQKNLYMTGVFIQGDVRNYNQRIYPMSEIRNAVDHLNSILNENHPIFGQLDHPDNLQIAAEKVSHVITKMWMEGANGFGKLRILPTPMGNIAKSILESGVMLGVSSRGSGNVDEASGRVSDFDIVTVDLVCQPSAPNAYPKPVYESLKNYRRNGDELLEMAYELNSNKAVQKYFQNEIINFIKGLK